MTAVPRPSTGSGRSLQPSLREEAALWARGCRLVAGVDEVGRGPLAGPLVAAAVILDPERRPAWLDEVRDSKLLAPRERERLAKVIEIEALAVGLGAASVAEIDAWGIVAANRVAMMRALSALRPQPHFAIVDGPAPTGLPCPQRAIVDGDAKCVTIAAASIVAKVARDRTMCRLDRDFPAYGFADHKGYATRAHLERLAAYGPCDQHRRAFLPVRRAEAAAADRADALSARKAAAVAAR